MAVNFRGVATGFRTVGVASTPQNLMMVRNTAASGLYIALYEWKLYKDMSALQSALGPTARVSAGAYTSGGSPMTKTMHSASGGTDSSSANCIITAAASADGTAAAITATAGTPTLWQTQPMKMVSLAGPAINPEPDVIPETCRTKPWVIPPSTNLLLQLVTAGLTSDHYYPDVFWEEWTTATG